MLSGNPPFQHRNVITKYQSIKVPAVIGRCRKPLIDLTVGAKDLIRRMLTVDTSKRLTCSECSLHPWFKDYEAGRLSSVHLWGMQERIKGWSVEKRLVGLIFVVLGVKSCML
eukprot:765790-Hanusia_phi.AAC.7